jgi:hypothetical protein
MARFDVPESYRLIVRAADQTFAFQEKGSTVVGVSGQEANVLRKAVFEIRLSMVQSSVQWFPGDSMRHRERRR